eukprot:TRINITY_DN2087_c0_g1_i1.p1 TRINITY_DN2087_c0_g1~~TRINITY_DN2087_c0_g1_i1.p1  ORF type:complete len:228 (-),score=50.82 TRINITY_DN2087_c0_g1_i1:154-837(-)
MTKRKGKNQRSKIVLLLVITVLVLNLASLIIPFSSFTFHDRTDSDYPECAVSFYFSWFGLWINSAHCPRTRYEGNGNYREVYSCSNGSNGLGCGFQELGAACFVMVLSAFLLNIASLVLWIKRRDLIMLGTLFAQCIFLLGGAVFWVAQGPQHVNIYNQQWKLYAFERKDNLQRGIDVSGGPIGWIIAIITIVMSIITIGLNVHHVRNVAKIHQRRRETRALMEAQF